METDLLTLDMSIQLKRYFNYNLLLKAATRYFVSPYCPAVLTNSSVSNIKLKKRFERKEMDGEKEYDITETAAAQSAFPEMLDFPE